MSRRIYWMIPDSSHARRTMDDLLLARVPAWRIHFVGHDGTDLSGLHGANVLQTSDVARAAQLGLVIGVLTGALAGIAAALYFRAEDGTPLWSIVTLLVLVGAVFGVWSASMIGISTPSRRLARFASAIERGQILLMVDVAASRVEEIEARLQALHPEAHLEGIEPEIPAFP